MAAFCEKLKEFPDISKWDISKVKNISGLFCYCTNLIKIPDISIWNTNEVEEMDNIFSECKSLISLPDISKWNLKNVKNKNYINNIIDLSMKSDINSIYKISSSLNCVQSESNSISIRDENVDRVNDNNNNINNNNDNNINDINQVDNDNNKEIDNEYYDTFYD